ncbi:undecaprenyl/decaprenyl-phosphate alpha-N-acetylglucosaminyl 1-phosphate transferase [bacterium]|nr:undecaprenyl/decaprenyl-phosphate alpha-N-acetylglucosaminyl 1-phosphate transferase [bacterium]
MLFLIFFLASFILSLILTPFIRWLAIRFDILDRPEISKRKIHTKAIPLLGGVAVFLSFFIVLLIAKYFSLLPGLVPSNKHLIGVIIAASFLMLGGFLDDKYHLSPIQQFIWPVLACLTIIISGIGITFMNNPFGSGYLYFDTVKIEILRLNGVPYYFTPLSDVLTFLWLLLLMYSTKLLDGLDGLVSGVTVIGALSITALCLFTQFYQPDVASMSLILAGAFSGFLIFNFHPAKIFLGEGGSLLAGFFLGVLAIISGSKFATTFLILGLAVLDLISVVFQRFFEKGHSLFSPDKKHLHFRLLEAGFSHRCAVIFYWFIALIFGFIALFLRTQGKFLALLALIVLGSFLIIFLSRKKEN